MNHIHCLVMNIHYINHHVFVLNLEIITRWLKIEFNLSFRKWIKIINTKYEYIKIFTLLTKYLFSNKNKTQYLIKSISLFIRLIIIPILRDWILLLHFIFSYFSYFNAFAYFLYFQESTKLLDQRTR